MSQQVQDIFERKSISFSLGGIDFLLEEFTRAEQRRYYRQVFRLAEKVRAAADLQVRSSEVDMIALSEAICESDEECVAWILDLATDQKIDSAWVRDHLNGRQISEFLAQVDQLNGTEGHMGNVLSRVGLAHAALKTSLGQSSSIDSADVGESLPTQ